MAISISSESSQLIKALLLQYQLTELERAYRISIMPPEHYSPERVADELYNEFKLRLKSTESLYRQAMAQLIDGDTSLQIPSPVDGYDDYLISFTSSGENRGSTEIALSQRRDNGRGDWDRHEFILKPFKNKDNTWYNILPHGTGYGSQGYSGQEAIAYIQEFLNGFYQALESEQSSTTVASEV